MYWHIGGMAIRLRNVTSFSLKGSNNADMGKLQETRCNCILLFDVNRTMVMNDSPVIIRVMRAFKHPDIEDLILERVLYALSDVVRLEIVRPGRGAEASCEELDRERPKSSMSYHFRVLRDAGLVHTRNVGTTHMNSLRSDILDSRFPRVT